MINVVAEAKENPANNKSIDEEFIDIEYINDCIERESISALLKLNRIDHSYPMHCSGDCPKEFLGTRRYCDECPKLTWWGSSQ